jgi:hypothetical protein
VKVLLLFVAAVIALSVWELRGGPRWRFPVVIFACACVAVLFMSQRVL